MNARQKAELMALMDKGMDDHEKESLIGLYGWDSPWKTFSRVGDERQIFRRVLPFDDEVKLVQQINDIKTKEARKT